MERARWNTELLHKKLNFVNPSNFWGSLHNGAAFFNTRSTDCPHFLVPVLLVSPV
jgi:hypothetical protein